MTLPQGVEVAGYELRLSQEEDTGGRINETTQYLNLTLDDGGAGPYLVLATERWAIDAAAIDDFAEMLEQFLAGIYSEDDK